MFKTYRGQCNVDFIFHQIITNSKIFSITFKSLMS